MMPDLYMIIWLNDYGIPDVTVLNVHRQGNITTVPGPSTQHPILIIFSVANFKIKKLILQKSFERKDAIQFRNDISKHDYKKRQILFKEQHKKRLSGEVDIVITGNEIVSKNFQTLVTCQSPLQENIMESWIYLVFI